MIPNTIHDPPLRLPYDHVDIPSTSTWKTSSNENDREMYIHTVHNRGIEIDILSDPDLQRATTLQNQYEAQC